METSRLFPRTQAAFLGKVVLLVFFLVGMISMLHAQDTLPPMKLLLDSLDDKQKSEKFIQRLVQPFKFKANRDSAERKRIYEYLKVLITAEDLQIDSTTIEEVSKELHQLAKSIAQNAGNDSALASSTSLLEAEFKRMLVNLDSKAGQTTIDSIQLQLRSVLQGMMDSTDQEALTVQKEITEKLAMIQKVQFACGMDQVKSYDAVLGDSIRVVYQKCLSTSIRVFGWYTDTQANPKEVNLNYLSDLIFKGYELSSDGTAKNPGALIGIFQGTAMQEAKKMRRNISLSVYSESPTELSAFLKSSGSQEKFFTELATLIRAHRLDGVNFYFDQINSADQMAFSAFLVELRKRVMEINAQFLITLSLPPIRIRSDVSRAIAYDFESLVPVVDFFLVHTNNLNVPESKVPFASSPLFQNPKVDRGSIEQSMGIYANQSIPASKLVLTLGYTGISWPVRNFTDRYQGMGTGERYTLSKVQQLISSGTDATVDVYGFDPEQASPYYNYSSGSSFRQLWYEDGVSHFKKYTWALDRGLGGVALWGLGESAGTSELWDALGASLVKVDSVVLSKVVLETDSLNLIGKLKLFWNDLQWASANDIYIQNSQLSDLMYCEYKIFSASLSDSLALRNVSVQNLADGLDLGSDSLKQMKLKDLILLKGGISDFWAKRQGDFNSGDIEANTVANDLVCACLIKRWDFYSSIFIKLTIGLFLMTALMIAVLVFMIVKVGDGWQWRGIVTIAVLVLSVLSLISGLFSLFLNGHVNVFGVGSEAVDLWFLILILVSGIFMGVVLNRVQNKRKYRKKNLP
ncbi:glycoside hydrolase family 18 protein [Algoriphagus namhaensis]